MLKLDLNELHRHGSVPLQAEIPGDSPLWQDGDLGFEAGGGLHADLVASRAGGDQVLVQGTLEATFRRPCRRCLEEVEVRYQHDVAILFAPVDELDPEEDPEIRPLELDGSRLDLSEAIREEVLLSAPAYVVCREDCKGLCPQCGTDLNESDCDCTVEVRDPRWDALRALQED